MIKTRSPTAVERSATAQIIFAASFDHLVGFGEQRRWHVEAERPCSLGVDKQLELASVVRCTRQATYDCTQHGLPTTRLPVPALRTIATAAPGGHHSSAGRIA
jgi:hypothetical protein